MQCGDKEQCDDKENSKKKKAAADSTKVQHNKCVLHCYGFFEF